MGQNYSDEAREKRREYTRKWRKLNQDKVKAVRRARNEDGRMYEAAKKWADKNPDKVKGYRKKQYWEDRDKRLAEKAAYYQANKAELLAKRKAYYQANKKAINKQALVVRHSSPQKMLRHNISAAVRLKLLNHGGKKYRASIDKVLPFKIPDLMTRLESLFQPGMTWANYGEWHVDHIKADARFNYTSVYEPEFAQSWSLDNLQPLWASDNCSKGSKNITEA